MTVDEITSLKNLPFPEATTKIEPPLKPSELPPEKEPWSTLASEEADELAQKSELAAAQAEIDAKNKLNLFNTEGTAADKVAADHAAADAKEAELRAKVAEEVAEEQARWATEQGELRFANRILATDPSLYQADADTTLPK